MAEIRQVNALDALLLKQLIVGYKTSEVFTVEVATSHDAVRFDLRLTRLERPLVKRYGALDEATLAAYATLAAQGYCLGAFVGDRCVAVALIEPVAWNRSLWVREFHVAAEQRGQGVGRRLMEAALELGDRLRMRCVVCETQTTNVPAMRFYWALGFTLDGIDVSYYSNQDCARGEIAVFMKRALEADAPVHPTH